MSPFTPNISRSGAPADVRLAQHDWQVVAGARSQGCAVLPGLLSADECRAMARLYQEEGCFRSRVVMGRHGFGRGEYRYFNYPLPALIDSLRAAFYARLVPVANAWNARLRRERDFPEDHASFLAQCREAGQSRLTPLLLQYERGDFNCLHQDLYGDLVFPIQVAILLSEPGKDFTGGEFVLTEERPRMQSRVEVVLLRRGDAVAFAVNSRPVQGARGCYQVWMRHGVSRIRSGIRHTVSIIFHDGR